jgi:GDP-4-dehydro-6-deoxy-D-mannose reductase
VAEQRTLLLVGAAGFLGRHLHSAAAAAGLFVVPATRQGTERTPPCDLLDPASVVATVEAAQPDLVVNAAGAASVGRSWERPGEAWAVNATGVLNLLEAVAQATPGAHVLCLSSADVYGVREQRELPLGEELEPCPVTPYGAGKAAMEALCGQYSRGRGMRIAVARAFNLIGPGQSPRFAVPGFARSIAAAEREGGAAELVLGNAAAVRDFVDVRDGARALLQLSLQGLTGTYNLCSGRGTTVAALAEELARQAQAEVLVSQDPGRARPADPPALVGDPGRLREAVGFVPEIALERSIADLLDEWRARPAGA